MKKIGKWFYEDLPEVLSTNDSVLYLLEKIWAPCIVSAAVQTKGRGRLGRTWTESAGNLFVSFAYEIEPQRAGHYVIISALAVLNVVRVFLPNQKVQIKWPNDVLVEGKKVSGILFEKGPKNYWVMGIGINVAATPKVENPLYEITSLADFKAKANRLEVLEKLVHEFDELEKKYLQNGFGGLKSLWLDNAYNRGKNVVIRQNGKELKGIFKGIDDNGALIVETEDELKTILAGDVFFRKITNE